MLVMSMDENTVLEPQKLAFDVELAPASQLSNISIEVARLFHASVLISSAASGTQENEVVSDELFLRAKAKVLKVEGVLGFKDMLEVSEVLADVTETTAPAKLRTLSRGRCRVFIASSPARELSKV